MPTVSNTYDDPIITQDPTIRTIVNAFANGMNSSAGEINHGVTTHNLLGGVWNLYKNTRNANATTNVLNNIIEMMMGIGTPCNSSNMEKENNPLDFNTFSSWDELIEQLVNLSNDQLKELIDSQKLRIVIGAKSTDTVSAETVFVIDSDVAEIEAKNIIAINSHLGSAILNVENIFMYGGELSATHLVASKNVVLGTASVVRNGKIGVVQDVFPFINPNGEKSLLTFLQFAAGAKNLSGVNLDFDEVKISKVTVFSSPQKKVELTPALMTSIPAGFTPSAADDYFSKMESDLSVYSIKQLVTLLAILKMMLQNSISLRDNAWTPEEVKKDAIKAVEKYQKAHDVIEAYLAQASSPATTAAQQIADIQSYISCGKTVDPNCQFATHGKKVGSAKWVSYMLSTYFNPAMTNVQDKSVLIQLVQTSADFCTKVLNHIANESQHLV